MSSRITSTTLTASNIDDKSVILSWNKDDFSNNNVVTASIMLHDITLNKITSNNLTISQIQSTTSDIGFNNLINGHGYEASIVGYNAQNVQTICSTNECTFTPCGPPDPVVLSKPFYDDISHNIIIDCLFGNNGGTPIKSLILTIFANHACNNKQDVSYNVINFTEDNKIINNKYTAIIPALNYSLGSVNTIAGVALNKKRQSEISNSVVVSTSNKPAPGKILNALSGFYGVMNKDSSGNVIFDDVGEISKINGNSGINVDTFQSYVPVSFEFGYENSNKSITFFNIKYIECKCLENVEGSDNLEIEKSQLFPMVPNYVWSNSNIFNVNLTTSKSYVLLKDFRVEAINENGSSHDSIIDDKVSAVTILPPILPDVSGNNYSLVVDSSSCTVSFPSQITRDISANEEIFYSVKLRDESNNYISELTTKTNAVTFYNDFKEKIIYNAEIQSICYLNSDLKNSWVNPFPRKSELKSNKIVVSGNISVSPDPPTNLSINTYLMDLNSGPLTAYTYKSCGVSVSWSAPEFTGYVSEPLTYTVTLMTNTSDPLEATEIPSIMDIDQVKQLYDASDLLPKYKIITTTREVTTAYFTSLGTSIVSSSATNIVIPINTQLYINVTASNNIKSSDAVSLTKPFFCNTETFDDVIVTAVSLPSQDEGLTSTVNIKVAQPLKTAIPSEFIGKTINLYRNIDSSLGCLPDKLLKTFDYDYDNISGYVYSDSISSSSTKYVYSAEIEGTYKNEKKLVSLPGYSSQISYIAKPTITDLVISSDLNAGKTTIQFILTKNNTGSLLGGIISLSNTINGNAYIVITPSDDTEKNTVLIKKTVSDLSLDTNIVPNIIISTTNSSTIFPESK